MILFKRKLQKIFKIFNLNKLFRIKKLCNYSIKDFLNKESKIIFIYREDNENISSIINRTNKSYRLAYKDLDDSKVIKKLLKNKALFITIKDLTTNTEFVLRNICKYLELEYDYNMINGYKFNNIYNYKKILIKK